MPGLASKTNDLLGCLKLRYRGLLLRGRQMAMVSWEKEVEEKEEEEKEEVEEKEAKEEKRRREAAPREIVEGEGE
ncbi:hypothetical protein HZH66_009798 [Vespula vulgaris]|uniref:Uncharacterized protein n=1 Tax=Vespula vulgaris TaxID=7454 RepID=A0A834JLZ7_VESVU|nr:hypothetical protein HZH66_009798 [Vespula vulgaris]